MFGDETEMKRFWNKFLEVCMRETIICPSVELKGMLLILVFKVIQKKHIMALSKNGKNTGTDYITGVM